MNNGTHKPTNYSLSQFAGTDRPSWLDDYNADMTKIDTAIKAAAAQSGTNTYTKNEADAKFETKASITTKLGNKADKSSVYTKAESDGRFAPKTATAPSTVGLTAAEYSRLYVDANGIVRCKPASK